jgi:hypothetical protein
VTGVGACSWPDPDMVDDVDEAVDFYTTLGLTLRVARSSGR